MWTKSILAVAVLAITTASAALACSCVRYRSAAEQLNSADLVFVGHAVASRVTVTSQWGDEGVTTFTMNEVIKGGSFGQVEIHHGMGSSASCGITFPLHQQRLVLANRDGSGRWITSLCSEPQYALQEFRAAAAAK